MVAEWRKLLELHPDEEYREGAGLQAWLPAGSHACGQAKANMKSAMHGQPNSDRRVFSDRNGKEKGSGPI